MSHVLSLETNPSSGRQSGPTGQMSASQERDLMIDYRVNAVPRQETNTPDMAAGILPGSPRFSGIPAVGAHLTHYHDSRMGCIFCSPEALIYFVELS
jgi:hypothetical protein